MSADTLPAARQSITPLRADRPINVAPILTPFPWTTPHRVAAFIALAGLFVLAGGGNLDLGAEESKLGLAAMESLGPYGQVFGSWEPSIWPAKLLPSLAWAWAEGGTPTSASIRWPDAIAGILVGLILAQRAAKTLSRPAGILVATTWFGSIALIDHSSTAGLNLIPGLFTIAALDRLFARGPTLLAGLFTAFAFLAAGWPPVALILLMAILIGRPHAGLSWRLLFFPASAFLAWSFWAISLAPTEAWAAALMLPLTDKPAWLLAPSVLAFALPWSPLATLTISPKLRESLNPQSRLLLTFWLQTVAASLLVGTLIPGLASAARVPALAGLAVAAAFAVERLLYAPDRLSPSTKHTLFLYSALALSLWAAIALLAGVYLAAAVPYYRSVCVWLIIFTLPTTALALRAAMRGHVPHSLLALFALALFLKLAHWGYYVPEGNYRLSQGPWGRAIGQWVPPRWPIYTTTTWPADLAFHTGRPFRRLASPKHLEYEPPGAHYVLLQASEFDNWPPPPQAPPLIKVARFLDEYDSPRVLARTPGKLPWLRQAPTTPEP